MRSGADAVVDLAGDDVELMSQRIMAACAGPLHLVIDPLQGLPAEAAVSCLSPSGRLVNIGDAAGSVARFSPATLRSRTLDYLGYTHSALTHEQKASALRQILRHADAGEYTVEQETFPLAYVSEAWQRQPAHTTDGQQLILVP